MPCGCKARAGCSATAPEPLGWRRPLWRGTGWGAVMADFNLDGAVDMAIVNGRVHRGLSNPLPVRTFRPYLVGLRGAQSIVRRRRQGPFPRSIADAAGIVRPA